MQSSEVGHYRILERIGGDSLGEIYRARDTRVGRTVALRVVTPASSAEPAPLEHLVGHARASAKLSHPNISALYDVIEDDGQVWLVSEFVSGQTLRALIGGQPLNPRRAVALAGQIADALAAADAVDLVHGDLRAETIFVNSKGTVKLVDFGLARWTVPQGTTSITHAEDLLSLGRVLHEMVTGAPAAAAPGDSTPDARLPGELVAVLRRMFARDERERYLSAAVLAADLRDVAARFDERAGESSGLIPLAHADSGSSMRSAAIWGAALAAAAALAWLVWAAARVR